MKTRTNMDLLFAAFDNLPKSHRRRMRAGFIAEVLPTLPPETRANFVAVISEAEYQAGLIHARREGPAFRQWLLHGHTPTPEAENDLDNRAKEAGQN